MFILLIFFKVSKRKPVDEIKEKINRLSKKTSRFNNFLKRIHPLIEGFREIENLNPKKKYRNEWLKYWAIGYIASIEGYIRLLIADLVNSGEPYLTNVSKFKDIKISLENFVSIHSGEVTLGDYIAHFLPINWIQDINTNLSTILDTDIHSAISSHACSAWNSKAVISVFPKIFTRTQRLFELRHLYAHELATNIKVNLKELEECIGSAAMYTSYIEEIMQEKFLFSKKNSKQESLFL